MGPIVAPPGCPRRRGVHGATALENRCILRRMGDLKGKRILDIGAGLGESSVYFALRAQASPIPICPPRWRASPSAWPICTVFAWPR